MNHLRRIVKRVFRVRAWAPALERSGAGLSGQRATLVRLAKNCLGTGSPCEDGAVERAERGAHRRYVLSQLVDDPADRRGQALAAADNGREYRQDVSVATSTLETSPSSWDNSASRGWPFGDVVLPSGKVRAFSESAMIRISVSGGG